MIIRMAESSNSNADSNPHEWDDARSIERLGGQRALIEKLVSLFLRDAPKQIEQAMHGIEMHDYDASHVAAHSLKGTSSNFCTAHLEKTCAELLEALKERDWQQARRIHQKLDQEFHQLEIEFQEFLKH
jgi:HPt (histidine-containing phosphotransfer) domain-containing protein